MLSIYVQLRKNPNFPAFLSLFCKTAVVLCTFAATLVHLLHNNVLQAFQACLKTTLDNESSNGKYLE